MKAWLSLFIFFFSIFLQAAEPKATPVAEPKTKPVAEQKAKPAAKPELKPVEYCNNDLVKFCAEKNKTINSSTVACLNKNSEKLTPACKSKLPVLAMSQGACFLDVLNICSKGIPPANLMLEINCLQKNKELLSFNCRKLVQYHNSVKNKVITNLQFFANACAVEAKTCGGWKTLAQRQCIINLNKQNKTTATCKQGIQTFLKSLGSK